jgi:uncharacterized membrane protein YkvA (DUF1232 family)
MTIIDAWKRGTRQLKVETYTIYLAYNDPRTPWYARMVALCVAGYAFSPIDLIPDFIPVLGYLDDLVLVPLGIAFVRKMIPATVLMECRKKAQLTMSQDYPTSWVAAGVIIIIWLLVAGLWVMILARSFRRLS